MLLASLAVGFLLSRYPAREIVIAVCGAIVFFIVFIKPEAGLYLLIFSMLLSPEILVGSAGGNTLGRGVTLRLEDFLLIVIGISWFFRTAVVKDLGLFLRTPLNRPIFLYVTACFVSTILGIMAGRVRSAAGLFYVLKYVEYFIIFFMVTNHVTRMELAKRLVVCLLVTAFIVSVVGIMQIPTGQRVSAPFEGREGEPNTLGGYLVFIMAISAGLFYWLGNHGKRLLICLLFFAMIPPFLYTGSRASFLGFIPAAFSFIMMMRQRMIVLGIALFLLLASPFLLPRPVLDRISYTFNQPEEPGQITIGGIRLDTSTSARIKSWGAALSDWSKHPIFGYGVTGYRFVDAQYPRTLVETGIVGFMAFMLLIYSIFSVAFRHYRIVSTSFSRGICMGFIAGCIGLVVHALGANTFIIVRIMEPFWFVAGLVCILPALEAGDKYLRKDHRG